MPMLLRKEIIMGRPKGSKNKAFKTPKPKRTAGNISRALERKGLGVKENAETDADRVWASRQIKESQKNLSTDALRELMEEAPLGAKPTFTRESKRTATTAIKRADDAPGIKGVLNEGSTANFDVPRQFRS
jgi:hypothetical protein